MNQKIKIGTTNALLTLTDKQYLASGGEAAIYAHSNTAYKLYHDPEHKMLPIKKIQELGNIKNLQVVIPQDIIYDATNGNPLGYSTKLINDSEPLLKLFTRTFKTDNNISHQMINDLVKQMQFVISDVHVGKCLIVDLNELNILVKIDPTIITPYFIDTDSYATPSYKASAVMDSIRDRKCSILDKNKVLHYNPNIESDWFSWSILAFQLYVNVHPYRGAHNNYKPNQKQKQMDDGISVFHKDVRVPPSVNNFGVIPPRHLDYFKRVFLNNERGIPPLPDSTIPLVMPTQLITVINGNDKLDVIEIHTYADDVTSIFQFMGISYVTTKSHIYANKKEIGTYKAKKALLCNANNSNIILATQLGSKITFAELNNSNQIGTALSENMFARNNCIYTVTNGKLIENSFIAFGNKIIHKSNEIENVSTISAKIYDGCVIQNLLGKYFLTIPYTQGSSFSKYIPNLDGYRVISAKSDKNITIVIAEQKGIYYRFIIIFDKKYNDFKVREVKDVVFDEINFCTMDNGLCVLLASPTELEIFSTIDKCEVINNPPIDSSMRLFSTTDGIFFRNGNSIHQLKKK